MKIETPTCEYRHRVPVQIRFNDVDMLGHVNNTVYLQYMDLGKADYFRQFAENGRLDRMSLGFVIANINVDFLAPTMMHEDIEVRTAVVEIGHKSVVLDQRVVNIVTGESKAAAKVTMVCFDTATGETHPVTDQWRDKISAYEGRKF